MKTELENCADNIDVAPGFSYSRSEVSPTNSVAGNSAMDDEGNQNTLCFATVFKSFTVAATDNTIIAIYKVLIRPGEGKTGVHKTVLCYRYSK